MAWATVALARMGHRAEARAALLAYFNARPTGKMRSEVNGADYQISVVRYFGDGAEEPFFTQEGSTNIEFDNWGEALWALGEYLRKYDDPALLEAATYRGPLYESARDFIVKPLIANTEKYGDGLIVAADTSIWEERQKDKKHFAFSTAMAIVGLREFAAVAQRAGDDAARRQALDDPALLEKGFAAAFIRDGKLRGTLEEGVKNDIDGALIPIINFGVVRDPKVIRDTVERMELLKVASGGYRRVRGTYTDPAIFEYWYERQEFLFVDLASRSSTGGSAGQRKPTRCWAGSWTRPRPTIISFRKCTWRCRASSFPARSAIPPARCRWSDTAPAPTSCTCLGKEDLIIIARTSLATLILMLAFGTASPAAQADYANLRALSRNQSEADRVLPASHCLHG